eukprot:5213541-Pyramimonas_sp.AAC.2
MASHWLRLRSCRQWPPKAPGRAPGEPPPARGKGWGGGQGDHLPLQNARSHHACTAPSPTTGVPDTRASSLRAAHTREPTT